MVNTNNANDREVRHCFKKEQHTAHEWHTFFCFGQGIDEDGKVLDIEDAQIGTTPRELHYWAGARLPVRQCTIVANHKEHSWDWSDDEQTVDERSYCPGKDVAVEDMTLMEKLSTPVEALRWRGKDNERKESAPPVLDGRQAYGDRVQNMKDQAAMINAYLGGREVTAVDVPMFLVLIKAHRLGRMQDYADNYDDIDGYMQIAREVVGDDMIQAATAREYAEIKKRGNQTDGRTMDSFVRAAGFDPNERQKPRHPYENVQRDEDNERCDKCGHAKHTGHVCLNMGSDNDCRCDA
ncbi:hypothetical protein SEA_LESNORAH_6 [Microbacterium phage LesNorah]|nr:hypothetical protein SEA_LESNORAH_6 [Microbacterium phage LesNorah]